MSNPSVRLFFFTVIQHQVEYLHCADFTRDLVLVDAGGGGCQNEHLQIFKRAGFQDVNTRGRNGALATKSFVVTVTTSELGVDLKRM